MTDEPIDAWLVLATCATGLACVVLLAALVVTDDRVMSGYLAQRAVVPHEAAAGMSAEEHRKRVFAERRQRFEGDAGPHKLASEIMTPSKRSPVLTR